VAVAAQAGGQPGVVVLVRQVAQRPVQRVTEVAAEPARVSGRFRDHQVDEAVGGEVGGTDALARGEFRGVTMVGVGVAVDDGAGAFWRQRGEPGVLGGQDAVGGQQGQCRRAGALSEQERDSGHREGDEVGQAAGDLGGQAVLLGPGGQLGARRVDHADQRQPEPGGQAGAAAGQPQRGRARGGSGAVVGDERARVAADAGQGHDQSGLAQPDRVGGGQPDQVAGAGPVRFAGTQHRLPRRDGPGNRGPGRIWPRRAARLGGHRGQHAAEKGGELAGGHDGVDQPVRMQVLRGLDVPGKS
jgi:hypothetical protein